MATHMRDAAWRSLQSVFQALPEDAVVDIRKTGQRPPEGVAMTVRVEITGAGDDGDKLDTWGAPPVEAGEKPTPKPRRGAAKAAPKSTADPPAGASQSGEAGQTGAASEGQPDK